MKEPAWRRYLRLARPDPAKDIDDELAFHLAMREAEYVASGMSAAEAKRVAHERFGRVHDARDACLEVDRRVLSAHRRSQTVDALGQDVRYALRGLRHNPMFALSVIVTLGLGIGATTAIFSAVSAALLRPLPFRDPAELVAVPGIDVPFAPNGVTALPDRGQISLPALAAMRDLFTSTAAYAPGGLNLSGGGDAARVNVAAVTTGFFQTLGVFPFTGRAFSDDEGRPGAGQVAILSHALWQRRFGGASVLGRSIELNEKPYQVVGIMPEGFAFPRSSDVWIPLSIPTTFSTFEAFRSYIPSTVIARLAPGTSHEVAATRLEAAWHNLPGYDARNHAGSALAPLQGALVGEKRGPLLMLLGVTGLLLLIACANVTNLLLARAATRRREMALRAALGASRRRLTTQLLIESVMLAGGGSLLGLGIALTSVGVMRRLLPADLLAVQSLTIDARVLALAVLLALVTGLVVGMLPARDASRTDPSETLKSAGAGLTASGRLRRLLVSAELAVTLTLLAGTGLLLRSFIKLLDVDPGFRTTSIATLEVTFPRAIERGTEADRLSVLQSVIGRLETTPGIEAAGVVNDLPLRGQGGILVSISPEDQTHADDAYGRYLQASAGYFHSLGIPLIRGRLMTSNDTRDAPHVIVVSESLARKVWPGQDPIGKRLNDARGGNDSGPPSYRTVIGLVGDTRDLHLDEEAQPQMYYPIAEQTPQNAAIVARGTLPPAAMIEAMRTAVREARASLPVYNVRTMGDVMSEALAPRRLNTLLMSGFGALSLLLAVVGVYGVVAYSVTRRTRELGIRAALGATQAQLVRLVAREGALVAAVGIAAGLLGAWAFSRAMRSMLYGVGAADLVTFVGAPLLLFLLVLAATMIPARRAASLDPATVIRLE